MYHLNLAILINKKKGNNINELVIKLYNSLATAYIKLGEFQKAKEALDEALMVSNIVYRGEDSPSKALVINGFGLYYSSINDDQDDKIKANEYYKRAYEINKKLNNYQGIIEVTNNLIINYIKLAKISQNDREVAINYYKEGLVYCFNLNKLLSEQGQNNNLINIKFSNLVRMAQCLIELKNYKLCKQYLDEADQLKKYIKDATELYGFYNTQGALYFALGDRETDYNKAIALHYHVALKSFKTARMLFVLLPSLKTKETPTLITNIAECYIRVCFYNEALKCFEENQRMNISDISIRVKETKQNIVLVKSKTGYITQKYIQPDGAVIEREILLKNGKPEIFYSKDIAIKKILQGLNQHDLGAISTLVDLAMTNQEKQKKKVCDKLLEIISEHLHDWLKINLDIKRLAPKILFKRLNVFIKEGVLLTQEFELIGRILLIREKNGDVSSAIQLFLKVLEQDNKQSYLSGKALYGLACVYVKQGRIEKAIASLEECIEVRTKVDPKMVYEAEGLLKKITPQEHAHKQEGRVENTKGKEKDEDIKPRTSLKETRLERVRAVLLKEIETKRLKPGTEEVELKVIGNRKEIEECCTKLGISKESFKIEEQEKGGDSNQKSKVYINIKALDQLRGQLSNKEIGK
ncbi:hypothetical protein NF27_HI00010 [Candidatus Jidaibacter acanthamoeba]|uniref:MalT-like TPR region domain-containing protein n=1 Tax=Candidatus Jidaibacter acanthamoebae TaxID=86105 RepID=A0A0C1QKE6_9RICK|nr:hypothetical protein NF27_HI00010 [Candidatus Jidaibacter acanthamoeba]